MRRKRLKRYKQEKSVAKRKRMLTTCIILGIITILYLVPALYFTQHFNYGTCINNIDVSFKKTQQVNAILSQEEKHYQLKINGVDSQSETLSASQMGLSFEVDKHYRLLEKEQEPFLWFIPLINNKKQNFVQSVEYDETLLKKSVDELGLLKTVTTELPVNASIRYIDGQYEIIPEVQGEMIDKEAIYNEISEAIRLQQKEIELEIKKYKIEPQYTKNSEALLAVKQTLNKYINAKITYPTTAGEIVIDQELIHTWLTIDEKFSIVIDEASITHYVTNLIENGTIKPTSIQFKTTEGNSISLSKGSFSSEINIEEETKQLIEDIKSGANITRKPIVNNIGKTYVEIDLTNQHLWLIKDDNCVIDGDIVTGNVSAGHKTPAGLFKIYSKGKNVVLRGDNYASPVTYWMPFNSGIGIHDANWRSQFGGTIYKTHGSHGCINCPYDLAKTVYGQVEVGTPVVCYE